MINQLGKICRALNPASSHKPYQSAMAVFSSASQASLTKVWAAGKFAAAAFGRGRDGTPAIYIANKKNRAKSIDRDRSLSFFGFL
jgi:hypothetical protein